MLPARVFAKGLPDQSLATCSTEAPILQEHFNANCFIRLCHPVEHFGAIIAAPTISILLTWPCVCASSSRPFSSLQPCRHRPSTPQLLRLFPFRHVPSCSQDRSCGRPILPSLGHVPHPVSSIFARYPAPERSTSSPSLPLCQTLSLSRKCDLKLPATTARVTFKVLNEPSYAILDYYHLIVSYSCSVYTRNGLSTDLFYA